MLVARAINGASGGTVGIANAYIADVCSGDDTRIVTDGARQLK